MLSDPQKRARLRPLRPRRRGPVRGRRAPARAGLRRLRRGVRRHLRRHLRRQGRGALLGLPRRGPALQPRGHARAGRARHRDQDPHPDAWRRARPARAAAPSPAPSRKTCATCGGQGQVRMQQGFFSIQQTCPQLPRHRPDGHPGPVQRLPRRGRVKEHKTLSVKIPAGVDEGDRIRLSGEGEPGVNGGPPGDLYVADAPQAARGLPARPRRPALRDADQLRARRRSAARSRSRRSTAPRPRSRSRPRPRAGRSSACAARASRACAARPTATSLPRRHRDAGQPHRAPEGAAARVRGDQPEGRRPPQPARQVLDGQGARVLRGLNRAIIRPRKS